MTEDTHTDSLSELLASGDVADMFGVTVGTVRNWERDHKLTAIRTPGGHRRFRRSDVDALLAGTTPAEVAS